MKLPRPLLLLPILSLTFTATASAVPITFLLDNVTSVGGTLPTSQTYVPGFPIAGSGNIDFGLGTGTLSLMNYSIIIDVNLDGDDAQIDISGWTQTITSIDASGNLTSTGGGSAACTNLGGLGSFVCQTVSPTIAGWPPADGASLPSSAVLDPGAQTITVIDNSTPAAGTITQFYSYTIVPEPGTALLMVGGLLGLAALRRRRGA